MSHSSKITLLLSARFARLLAALVFGCLASSVANGDQRPVASQTPAFYLAMGSAQQETPQEQRWKEREIQRYGPNGKKDVMEEKSSEYLKLVLVPLLLFILALAVIRLKDF